MAKRLTDTFKWDAPFFQKLPPVWKLFWFYLFDKCDNAGLWVVNFEIASFLIGADVNEDEFRELFKDRFKSLDAGKVFFIPEFLIIQHGTEILDPDNNNAHKSVINKLRPYGLEGDFLYGHDLPFKD